MPRLLPLAVLLLAPAGAHAAQIPVSGVTGTPQHVVSNTGAQAVTWGGDTLSGCVLAANAAGCTAWTEDFGGAGTMAGYGLGYTNSGPFAVAVRNTGAAGTARIFSDGLGDTTTPAFEHADTGNFVNPSGSVVRFHSPTVALTLSHLTQSGSTRHIRVVAVDITEGFQDDVTPATIFGGSSFSDHKLFLASNAGRPIVVTQSPTGNVQHAFYDGTTPADDTAAELNTTAAWRSASAAFTSGGTVLDLASGPSGLFMLASLSGSDPAPYVYTHRYTPATNSAQSTSSFTSLAKKAVPLASGATASSLTQSTAGTLFAGYLVGGATWVASSTDGGATWTAPLPVDCGGSSSARVSAGGPAMFLLGRSASAFSLVSATDRPAECQPKVETPAPGPGPGPGTGTGTDTGTKTGTGTSTTRQVTKTIGGVKVVLKTPTACTKRGKAVLLTIEPVKGVSLRGARFTAVSFLVDRKKASKRPDRTAPFKLAFKTTTLKKGTHKVVAKVTIRPRGKKPQTKTINGTFTVC